MTICDHDVRKEADNSEQVLYIHGDVLGSSETVTDDSGKLVGQARKYDPFGGPTDLNLPKAFPGGALMSTDVHLGFAGHEEDSETGLINMRGRIYNPRVGHFLTPDPFLPNPMSSIGLGRYSYALNNPLTYTDPTGFEMCNYRCTMDPENVNIDRPKSKTVVSTPLIDTGDSPATGGGDQPAVGGGDQPAAGGGDQPAVGGGGGIGFSPYDSSTWTPGQNGVEMCGAGGFCGMQRRWPGGGVQRDNDTWVDVPLKGGFVQALPMGAYQDQYEYRPDNSNKLTVDFNRAQVADGPNNTVTVNGPSRSTPVQGMSAATSRGGGQNTGGRRVLPPEPGLVSSFLQPDDFLGVPGLLRAALKGAVMGAMALGTVVVKDAVEKGVKVGAKEGGEKLAKDAVEAIESWVGEGARLVKNGADDIVVVSKDGTRRVRFDVNNPSPHASPHAHVEELVDDIWVKSGPIYPTDVPAR